MLQNELFCGNLEDVKEIVCEARGGVGEDHGARDSLLRSMFGRENILISER